MSSTISLFKPDDSPVKVWSLIMTVFGDLAGEEGDEISGQSLAILMEGLGIRADATRVALHRLRKDGWVISRKSGRTAHYRLSNHGLQETRKASPRIYQKSILPCDLKIALLPHQTGLTPSQKVQSLEVMPNLWLTPHSIEGAWDLIPKTSTPEWMTELILSEQNQLAFDKLYNWLEGLSKGRHIDLRRRALFRISVVHAWRRPILRLPEVAECALPQDHCVVQCRGKVFALLSENERPSVKELTGLEVA